MKIMKENLNGCDNKQSYFPKDNSKYFNDCELSLVDWLRQFTDGTVYNKI